MRASAVRPRRTAPPQPITLSGVSLPSNKPVVLIADKLAESTVAALGDQVEVRWVDGPDRPKLLEAVADADAILVRSAKMHDLPVPETVKAIGRAGAGVLMQRPLAQRPVRG